MLGEGKPENQNHAIIFTRGEGLQTIDMNQVCIIGASCSARILGPFSYDHASTTGTLYGGDPENEKSAARVFEETRWCEVSINTWCKRTHIYWQVYFTYWPFTL